MKAVVLAIVLVAAPLAFAAPASACPDPDNPCDPPPMSICPSSGSLKADPVRWAYCKVFG